MEYLVEDAALLIESYLMDDGDSWAPPGERAPVPKKDWNDIGFGGHVELIIHLIDKDRGSEFSRISQVVRGVCMSGDVDLLNMLAIMGITDFTEGLKEHLEYVHDTASIDAVSWMIAHGASTSNSKLLREPAHHNDIDMCKLLVSAGCSGREHLAKYSGMYGNLEMLDLIHAPTIQEIIDALTYGCKHDEYEFVKEVFPVPTVANVESTATVTLIANMLMPFAVANDHIAIVEFLLEKKADPNNALSSMCEYGRYKSLRVLQRAGATRCACMMKPEEHTQRYMQLRREDREEAERNELAARIRGLKRPRSE